MSDLTLLACQLAIPAMTTIEQRDAHLRRAVAKVSDALVLADQAVDLVVLPELSSIDYSAETFARLDQLAEPVDGPSFQAWRELACRHQTTVLFGFPRADGDRYFISMAAVGPDGALLGHYDKIHLAQFGASMEKQYFQRGSQLFVFDIKGFRLAPIICYDIRIPELTRALVTEHGVDAILHCGAYYRDASFATWHAFATTRALENQVYLLSVNRAGQDYGNSVWCLPWMDEQLLATVFPPHEECLQLLQLGREQIRQARQQYSFLADRLPDYRLPVTTGSVGSLPVDSEE